MQISVSSNQSGLQELVPARAVTQRNLVSKNKTDKKKITIGLLNPGGLWTTGDSMESML